MRKSRESGIRKLEEREVIGKYTHFLKYWNVSRQEIKGNM